jgi:microsomal dipeptidase-like Zn-dependent dipeptidase
MEILAAGLTKRGYKEDAIAKLLGGNFARVLGSVCG